MVTMLRRVTADYPLLLVTLALSLFGVAMVYSAGQTDVSVGYVATAYRRQAAWLVAALIAAYVISRSPVRLIEWSATPMYIVAVILLVLVMLFGSGAGTAASMKGWLTIGGVRIGQPGELAKIAVVLMLAKVLSQRRDPVRSLFDLWQPALIVGVPWVLIMLQPDLGTGIVFVGIFFAMLFWAGVPWPLLLLLASPAVSLVLAFNTGAWGVWFLLLVGLVFWMRPYLVEGVLVVVANVVMGVVAPLLWERLQPYQQKRLLVFLDPSIDPQRSGYHVIQSQVAIGSGGLFGKGFTDGSQKRLAFLPAQHTDFIFAVVGEELGFIGVTIALALFLALFLRCIRVATRGNDAFASLVAFGIASTWFVHVIENVGMTLSLMPVTGIPLPFFSYGGSFMLVSWMAVGVLLALSAEGRGRADELLR
ncbi:MAG: rod shape-determining protein RodA [Gemmatimonadaceae bacterium]|nr:rod shape-determining protein RodA [Gemmatimonadaceae bacterium]